MDISFVDTWLRTFKALQPSGELAKLNASHKNKVCLAGKKSYQIFDNDYGLSSY